MGKHSREQPYDEITDMLKAIQEKERIQDRMVRKFQKLICNEGLSSSVINDLPYPMAVFEQDGDLVFVNNALSEKTGLYTADLSKSKHSILNRITDANLPILDAVESVFMNKTTAITRLSDPLDIFMSDRSGRKSSSPEYREAVFFPIVGDEGETAIQGAVIFMK